MLFYQVITGLAMCVCISSALAADKVLTACSSPNWVPSNWETKTGIDGLFVDVLDHFALHSDFQIQYSAVGSWARCLKLVETGEIDIALGAYKTTERQVWGEYSDVISLDTTRIFSLENKLQLVRLDDLTGYLGGVRIGDSYGWQVDDFIENQDKALKAILYLHSEELMIKMLANNRIDYFPGVEGNTYSLITKLKQQGELKTNISIKAIGPSFSINSLHYVISKKRQDAKALVDQLNRFYEIHYDKEALERLALENHQKYLEYIKGSNP